MKPCRDLAIGRRIHAHIIKTQSKLDIILQTSLLNMYSKCGSIDDARSIFDNMESKDIISWNAMISGYGQNGNSKEAIELFQQMQQSGIQPDHVTFTIALSACANLGDLSLGKKIHSQINESGIEWTIEMKNSLLNMYSKCGSIDDACSIFDNMKSKNIISWNAMISGYEQNGNSKEAIELFQQMQQSGIQPNHVTFTVALSACANLADLSLGKKIHSQINESGIEWTY